MALPAPVTAFAISLKSPPLRAQAVEGKTLTHTLELAAMVHTIAEVPDPTASPIRQQVVALSAVTLWPPRSAHTLVLAAVVPKAAVVDGPAAPLVLLERKASPATTDIRVGRIDTEVFAAVGSFSTEIHGQTILVIWC